MATGFTHSAFAEFTAAATSQANLIQERGESVLRSISNVTTEGLQGNSAGASQTMAEQINQASGLAKQSIADLQTRGQGFGDQMTGSDNRFASAIGG